MTRVGVRTKARMCGLKKKHATREAADRHKARLVRKGASPGRLQVYECRHGDEPHFHVGHVGKRAAGR